MRRRFISVAIHSAPAESGEFFVRRTLDPTIGFEDPNGREHRSVHDAVIGDAALDPIGLLSLVSFQYLPFDRTPFRGVRKLYLDAKEDCARPISEVLTEFKAPERLELSGRRAVSRLLRCIVSELEARLQRAEGLVILLSGGLDSRLILAALLHLRALGRVTNQIRAISWGKENCADLSLARYICEQERLRWEGIPLNIETLRTNIFECAGTIGPLVSPVHLHAMPKLRDMVDRDEMVVVGTLGNAVIRGEYLWRNVSYTNLPRPVDWLELLAPEFRKAAMQEYDQALWGYRAAIPAGSAVHCYEVEMFTSYYQGLLLYTYQYLDKIGVSYWQAFSSPELLDEARSIYPLLRNERLARACIRRLWPSLAGIPTTNLTGPDNRDRSLARLDPAMHDYQNWVIQLSDELVDSARGAVELSGGALSPASPNRALRRVKAGGPGAREASYLLAYLAGLGAFLNSRNGRQAGRRVGDGSVDTQPPVRSSKGAPMPPWGFASQPLDGWRERAAGRLRQVKNLAAQLLR